MTIRQLGVPTPLVAFYPPIRKEVEALYPGAKFSRERRVLDEDELIRFLGDCDAAIIGFGRSIGNRYPGLAEITVRCPIRQPNA